MGKQRNFRRARRNRGMLWALAIVGSLGMTVVAVQPAAAADTASSSLGTSYGSPAAMVDGDLGGVWKSWGAPATSDWVMVDRGSTLSLNQVDLYMTDPNSPNDRIQQGVLEISTNGTSWTSLGSFSNQNDVHVTAPAGTTARYVRARPTASQSNWLVVREFAADRNLASTTLWTWSGTVGSMTDGSLSSFWKSSSGPTTSDTVQVDRGAVLGLNQADLYMTEPNSPNDRIQQGVVEISTNGATWSALASFSNQNDVHVTAPAGTTARFVRARATANQSNWLVVRELSVGAAAAAPPAQPSSGPGGSNYPHADWTVSSGGTGNDAWYVFQPASPKPASAPVVVFTHGYGEFSGYNSTYHFLRHLTRKGYVVVYPRWQTGIGNPLGIEATMTSAKAGILGAISWLQANPSEVQPQMDKVGYAGFSYGGIITLNLTNRYVSLGMPAPKSIYLIEPHDGNQEDELDDSLSGIPSSVKLTCSVSDDIGANTPSGCKTAFPLLGHIANADKDYVTYYDDLFGSPYLAANHQSVCAPPAPGQGTDACGTTEDIRVDGMDYFAFWKTAVALQTCANSGVDCAYALDDTSQHRDMGQWSNGTSVRTMRITDAPAAP
jgi:F5/8 type C domain/Cutinase